MFDINKLYNSSIIEIADIAEIIYDEDGTEKGLSADCVQKITAILMDLEASIENRVERERDEAVEEIEEKYADIMKQMDTAKDGAYDKAYDEGYDAGYEDGVDFKKRIENKA